MPNISRRYKTNNIQSVRFRRQYWTPARASKWLKKHKFSNVVHHDTTAHDLRYKQFNNLKTKRYRIKRISPTIQFILEY